MPIAYQCRGCKVMKPAKWIGRCPDCGSFYNIEQRHEDIPGAEAAEPTDGEVISLQDAVETVREIPRLETDIKGLDHVLGGGFVNNSLTLLCGDPGCGKSTLLIQTFQALARRRYPVLYVTGEQTVADIARRAKSFGKFPARFMAVRETNIDAILDHIEEHHPAVVAIDSIQTINVDDDLEIGSAASIKAAVRTFMDFAKEHNVAMILIGHVTKGGALGGPRALEHYVDVNLFLANGSASAVEKGKHRILKCENKNRYSEVPREAHFKMTEGGLLEIDTPPPEDPKSRNDRPALDDIFEGVL